jgi:hypothetical protein
MFRPTVPIQKAEFLPCFETKKRIVTGVTAKIVQHTPTERERERETERESKKNRYNKNGHGIPFVQTNFNHSPKLYKLHSPISPPSLLTDCLDTTHVQQETQQQLQFGYHELAW